MKPASHTSLYYMKHIKVMALGGLVALLMFPQALFAAGEFEISAWIPYWRSEKGVASINPRLDLFTEVNPFVYTVKMNGELNEAGSLDANEWQWLQGQARAKGIDFIPTVMWANADAMDEVFRDPEKRAFHVRSIAQAVFRRGFDGIDIDYEAKYAKTRPYFSLFLRDLEEAIGYNKKIMCTIEARTPLLARYDSPESIPDDIEYANDFVEINRYCDRVRIMAYDQGRFDRAENKANPDPYIPVADVDWVEKVMRLAAEDIDPGKLVIGVPTYGYEYDMFLDSDGDTRYSRLWSFNPGYVDEVIDATGAQPKRNSAGEMFLIYPAHLSPDPAIPLPDATRVMSWSDSEAIKDKVELAKELGLRGIAVFKVDGGEDQGIWEVLDGVDGLAIEAADPAAGVTSLANARSFTNMPEVNLERGMRVEPVRKLQEFLNAQGFAVAQVGGGSPGNETIFFGPATENALIRFQKHYGITPSVGYYGPVTRALISTL